MSDVLIRAAPAIVSYAERPDRDDTRFDRWGQRVAAPVAVALSRLRPGGARRFLRAVAAAEVGLDAAGDDALRAAAGGAALALRRMQGLGSDAMAPLFAVLREAAHRSIGQRPYDVQLLGSRAITRGELAEMQTGEGKTLTAAIAAAAAALTGWPVHVVSTSDYLAQRDARALGPVRTQQPGAPSTVARSSMARTRKSRSTICATACACGAPRATFGASSNAWCRARRASRCACGACTSPSSTRPTA
jgi:preprotein translocase subunit SecA